MVNIVSKGLAMLGYQLVRKGRPPAEFVGQYRRHLKEIRHNSRNLRVFKEFRYDAGEHTVSCVDFECAFAANHISRRNPGNILDIGSYRHFIIGLEAHYPVTALDVRAVQPITVNETIVTSDAKNIRLADQSFDAVVSLCAIEHFGLGRYGDEYDTEGDVKAFAEMVRVLRPGGVLIFTTTFNAGQPGIAFNAHRIYDHGMLRELCRGLHPVEEKAFSFRTGGFCRLDQVTTKPNDYDVYCGSWAK
jgi:SAM-dependent methyltransferase